MPFKISALLNPINSIPFVNLNSTAVFIYLSHSPNVFSKWKHKHPGCVIASVISTDHSEPEISKQHRVDESDFPGKQVLGWTIHQRTCWGFHRGRKSGNAGLDKMRLGLPCGLSGSMGRKRWASVPSPLQVGWRVLSTFDSLLAAGCPGSEPDQARRVSTHGGARRARRTGAPAAGGPIWASSKQQGGAAIPWKVRNCEALRSQLHLFPRWEHWSGRQPSGRRWRAQRGHVSSLISSSEGKGETTSARGLRSGPQQGSGRLGEAWLEPRVPRAGTGFLLVSAGTRWPCCPLEPRWDPASTGQWCSSPLNGKRSGAQFICGRKNLTWLHTLYLTRLLPPIIFFMKEVESPLGPYPGSNVGDVRQVGVVVWWGKPQDDTCVAPPTALGSQAQRPW